ncbi:MAG: type III secretion system chaperone [Succinivibrionaceae bacterium]|nr:type III secretion system chaperone [Succinivibrionaceae bacterium]
MLGKHLINNLCSSLGLGIEIDASNTITFRADDIQITLTLFEDTNEVAMTSELGPLPTQGRESLLLVLMQGNHHRRETHGATLAVTGDGRRLALCRLMPADILDDSSFMAITEQFANTAEFYARMLGAAGTAAPGEVPEAHLPHGMIPV